MTPGALLLCASQAVGSVEYAVQEGDEATRCELERLGFELFA
jgi:hypothetical protein